MNIVIFSSSNQPHDADRKLAFSLGQSIAATGWTTVNGGGPGLMNAVLEGAKSKGGATYAVQLSRTQRIQSPFADASEAFANLIERQNRMMARADAFVALPGGVGTFFEIFQVLALKNAGELPAETPLILLSSSFSRLETHLRDLVRSGYARPEALAFFEVVPTVEACMDRLERYFGAQHGGRGSIMTQ